MYSLFTLLNSLHLRSLLYIPDGNFLQCAFKLTCLREVLVESSNLEREKERERDTERERETERDTERQRETERDVHFKMSFEI